MSLIYKFKKEKLVDGNYAVRPRIFVVLAGRNTSIEIPALIDTGCDTTVIPEGIARAVGLDMSGNKNKIFAYRESSDVIESFANITFLGKADRLSVVLPRVPVLIALSKQGVEDEADITLGINGIFDAFDIAFKKSQNQIVMKKANRVRKLHS
jgi:hypothetical protein